MQLGFSKRAEIQIKHTNNIIKHQATLIWFQFSLTHHNQAKAMENAIALKNGNQDFRQHSSPF